jgi:hypothetical protein
MIALANDAAGRLFPEQGPLIGQGGDEALPAALAPLLDGSARETDSYAQAASIMWKPTPSAAQAAGLLLSFTCEGCQT